MLMTLEQRRDIALKLLANAGLRRWQRAPALWRWLWSLGLDIPQPAFLDERSAIPAAFCGFALVWGALRLLEAIQPGSFELMPLLPWLAVGVLCGSAVAGLNAHRRHRLGLPAWRDLNGALAIS